MNVNRLNYIGSKYQLLTWIETNILEKTGWSSFEDKRFADLFAGTGIVSYHFRLKNAIVFSNDVELYSSIITHALTRSIYTENCKNIITILNQEINEKKYEETIGFITSKYSPNDGNERMFFTIDNAKRIDYIRTRIEDLRSSMNEDEYKFVLASLILSSDAVSNVPAVYGCYLKNFKAKALKNLVLEPIHTIIESPKQQSCTFQEDVLSDKLLEAVNVDFAYLDPPYNERQYSKNYFPLNMIALTPKQQEIELPLKGKTGIPESCFLSPFCRKKETENALVRLLSNLKSQWIFMSYNSESILSKEKVIELMSVYGQMSVIEKEYKRFKSFEYNEDASIKEYLFCLKRSQ